jgi:hypothetical protein
MDNEEEEEEHFPEQEVHKNSHSYMLHITPLQCELYSRANK